LPVTSQSKSSPPTIPALARYLTAALTAALTAGLVLAGCGNKKPGVKPDGSIEAVLTDGSVKITPAFDECASVIVVASPESTHVDQGVMVSASVRGSDASTAVTFRYHWTASAGRFADPSAAATTFTCPGMDRAGPAILTLTVSDGSACDVKRTLTIGCLGRADAGSGTDAGGGTGDGGQTDSAGAGGATGVGGGAGGADNGEGGVSGMGGSGGTVAPCEGDPSLCEGTLCNQCTFGVQPGETDLCSTVGDGCFNCVPDGDGCAHLASDRERVKCWALYACIRDTGCMKNADVLTCWCGVGEGTDASTDPDYVTKCLAGTKPAHGKCAQQFVDAAGSSDPAVINQHIIDPQIALGSAVNLATCRASFCGQKPDSSAPGACPLW
jgi:hypothetical protein